MIAHLRGKLIHKQPGQAIIEAGGVGYDVTISVPTFTGLPVAGAETSLHIYTQVSEDQIALFGFQDREEKRLFERLWDNTRYFQGELRGAGFNVGGINTPATETPITPVILGEGRTAMDFSRALFEEGVMGTGIAFPTVPEGKARIRLILTSEHTRAQLDQALETLERVAKRMRILS